MLMPCSVSIAQLFLCLLTNMLSATASMSRQGISLVQKQSTFYRSQNIKKVHQSDRIFINPKSEFLKTKIIKKIITTYKSYGHSSVKYCIDYQFNLRINDLLKMAKESVTAVTPLDLSTAFDTIEHHTAGQIVTYYGISDLALSVTFFQSRQLSKIALLTFQVSSCHIKEG